MTDLDSIWRKHASTIPDILKERPDFRFDVAHYHKEVPALPADAVILARHYRDYGQSAGNKPNLYARTVVNSPEIDEVIAEIVIDPALAEAIAEGQPGACELAFELMHLGPPVDAVISDFSMSVYLRQHGDIARAKMDPLLHYLMYGAAEGRRILGELRKGQHHGQLAYRPDRPTCLIAVHECSRTGAPIVGLDLAREATKTHNVIVAALRDGPLLDAFCETACEVLISSTPFQDFDLYSGDVLKKIDFAICNSVETWVYVPLLVAKDIPFAAYIHEYADYTFPSYKAAFSALLTDIVVFSSEHVRDSWAGRLKDICFDTEGDSVVIPQRPLVIGGVDAPELSGARARLSALLGKDLTGVRLICGAGHLQWRKGTDIFSTTAQICRHRDPDTVFLWIGDGLNFEDLNFGAWASYHLRQIGADDPAGNLFFLPAGPAYPDVLAASDAMYVSSRLDPLPNVVFDALERGCRIVQFEGASGFGDAVYQTSDHLVSVEYANPDAAATAILALPRKTPILAEDRAPTAKPQLFARIHQALRTRLAKQRYFVRGASQIDVSVMFAAEPDGSPLRIREREKTLRYRRRLVWRDLDEVKSELARSDNWVHRNLRLAPYGIAEPADVPAFSMHIHAFYTDELADDLKRYRAYALAKRIVVTTDTPKKGEEIRRILASEGLTGEIVLVENRGRDILPFMDLFRDGGPAGEDEIWCHLHQKKSVNTTKSGDVWRTFLMRILLGNQTEVSDALTIIDQPGVGFVAPFDPYFIPWNESRRLLPKFAPRLPGPMPDNPLLFPVGNMFWTRRSVVLAMNDVFGHAYPWPNEPIANDGTEFHLIERLWPAMTTHLGLESVFVHKLDEKRV